MEPWIRSTALCAIAGSLVLASRAADARERWTPAEAGAWYARQPWMVGADYIPASAINQLEMWEAETFDPRRIDVELGWAEGTGMNTMRVFLHDLLWLQDPAGFQARRQGPLRGMKSGSRREGWAAVVGSKAVRGRRCS